MSSFAASLLSFIGLKSTSKRATPRVISSIVDNLSQPSIHDRSIYYAPSLRSPHLAFESPLFKAHPARFVSLSELIPGLAPPSEVQLSDLESVEAEGEIVAFETKEEDELKSRLEHSLAFTPLPPTPTTPELEPSSPSPISIFVSAFFDSKPKRRASPSLYLNEHEWSFCEKHNLSAEEFLELDFDVVLSPKFNEKCFSPPPSSLRRA
ncbi:uncharacterized protein JCM6883_000440 [Sporobolomyces salmoneus]|uniref:uncharacterized protein n=1 Tax=Sporobolomyces salmoneus TaxID=183962 RepID=UPI003175E815